MLIAVLRELVPVLLILYAADCISLLRRDDLVLVSHIGERFRLVRSRIVFAAAFPEGSSFLLPRRLVLLGASGAFLPGKETAGPRRFESASYTFVPYEGLSGISVDGSTLLAAGHTVRCSSPAMSVASAEALSSLARAKPGKRAAAVQALLRVESGATGIRQRRRILVAEAHRLRDACWVLFAILVVLLPASTYVGALAFYAPISAAGFVATYAVVLFLSVRSRRRLRAQGIPTPHAPIASLAMSPPSAARASVSLMRSGFEGFDGLAVAATLLRGSRLAPLLSAKLHGSRVASQEEAGPEWRAYWAARLDLCEALARRSRGRRGEGAAVPRLADSQSAAVCVFCRAEYTSASVERCQDCAFPLMVLDSR